MNRTMQAIFFSSGLTLSVACANVNAKHEIKTVKNGDTPSKNAVAKHPVECTSIAGTETLTPNKFYPTPIELGSQKHKAIKLKNAADFNIKTCPVIATSATLDPLCATPEGSTTPHDPILNVGDRYFIGLKNSTEHFYAWRKGGSDFLSFDLAGNDTWLKGTDGNGNDYFIYLEPNLDQNGNLLKNYKVEVFYADNKTCVKERPDTVELAARKFDGISKEGNTTGGPEPHHP